MKEPEDNTLKQGELEELSKAELVALVRLYSKLFFAMGGFLYLAVK